LLESASLMRMVLLSGIIIAVIVLRIADFASITGV